MKPGVGSRLVPEFTLAVLPVQFAGGVAASMAIDGPGGLALVFGAALATFPGYLLGLAIQASKRRASLRDHAGWLLQMGVGALAASVYGLVEIVGRIP